MKKTLISIAILAVLLVLMNWVYTVFFFEKDLMAHSDLIELSRKVTADSCEMIYLGESSNKTYSYNDNDKRKISEMLADYFPERRCGDLTKEASHAEVYYYLLKNISRESKVQTVVVTMNLRSFGPNWIYSTLETAIQKQLVLIKGYPPLLGRALLAFKAYPIHTESEWNQKAKLAWDTTPLEFPYPFPYHTVAEWCGQAATSELMKTFIKNYAFQIHPDNPRVKDFDRIVRLCRKRGWNLFFNLMAENTDLAEQMVGADLTYLMRENANWLVARYEAMGVTVVNNLEVVRDKDFIDRDWPTEHYCEEGRRTIARRVAEAIN